MSTSINPGEKQPSSAPVPRSASEISAAADSSSPPPRHISKTEEPVPPPLQPGQMLGKCQIEKLIAQGGMGAVYLARHTELGVPVAVKIMLPQKNDRDQEENTRRFVRESKLALQSHHPNLVQVLEADKDETTGLAYIVQEYVNGGAVADLLKAGPLTETRTLDIAISVAAALVALGKFNIIHRDVKPENILFTRQGEVKLTDMGIAKDCCDQNERLTMSNIMMGSPDYIAPEQARNTKRVDARADIYGLGASCYHMLCGQTPYPGNGTYDVIQKLIINPTPDPKQKNPEISRPMADMIMWMMAKKPEHRPDNAQVLLAELQEIRRGGSSSAQRHLQKNAAKIAWNNTVVRGVIAGIMFLLILAGILWLMTNH